MYKKTFVILQLACNGTLSWYLLMMEATTVQQKLLRVTSTNPHVILLNLPSRLGKGGSIAQTILTQTLKDCVAFMDVDLSADPSELEKLLPYIENYDVVIGSRILRDGLKQVKRPFYRTYLSNSYSKIFRLLFRIPIYDPQCGFKIFRRNVTRRLFSDIITVGFAFDTE